MLRTTNTTHRPASATGRGVVALLLVAGVAWAALASEEAGKRYHRDSKSMEQASLAMSRALILEDMAAARKALEQLAEISPPLAPEAKEIFGRPIYDADRALQQTLTRAREFAALENVSRTFDEFIWVRRTCLSCHEISRKEGRLPATGPLRPATP